jgi:hypothetical protein
MFKLIFLILALTGLVACSPSQQVIQTAMAETQAAWTQVPTQTAFSTYTTYPTYTLQSTIFITKVVTPPFTPTPIYTPTITPTPNNTQTTTPTTNPLTLSRGDGFYLVGIDIAPGIWRSQGNGDGCYWSITTRTDDIINNHFGMAGGTMYIPATAFQVQLQDCGDWAYLGP